MYTTMRPHRTLTRFILATAVVIAVGVPAGVQATPEPAGLVPDPARQPSFHRSQTSGTPVTTLRIPTISLDEVVRSGVSLDVIDRGVAHWAGTAGPGDEGNVVLAGHRTTHTRPFEDLDRVSVGDLVYLDDGSGFEVIYRVDKTFIVDPSDLWITYNRDRPSLTMFACHPKGSARYRIVVTAELLTGRKIA